MPTYEADVTVPSNITDYFNYFTGPGAVTNLRVHDGKFVFQFEAENVWEAAEVLHDVRAESSGIAGYDGSISQGREVDDGKAR